MNAMLTWWGVALAIVNHQSQGTSIIASDTLVEVVPVFVAVMVWIIRVLIIGTFSLAGNRLFSQADAPVQAHPSVPVMRRTDPASRPAPAQPVVVQSLPKSNPVVEHRPATRPEPTYHPASMTGYKPVDHSRQ
jgi:hypothetical protein